ncbi:metal binding Ada-like protein [Pontibacter mucosus]|uniref:Metal binding Ada-like protein n=1 Tax=Pontibacter mucosus TaxID=1649266 RepID=A0A2T5YEE1_9BACT|nr:Ada metal-binding domain-containing protein [Pontibacter mucosus]PTX15082.1 metal binding Ada-like protein [Pontibacter mucosus]
MIRHTNLFNGELRSSIRQARIQFGGNRKLKIYGKLTCSLGKKMRKENRVFFLTENDAVENGYRPCGHCMRAAYKKWKDELV